MKPTPKQIIDKCLKVMASCKTWEQRKAGLKYLKLAIKAVGE